MDNSGGAGGLIIDGQLGSRKSKSMSRASNARLMSGVHKAQRAVRSMSAMRPTSPRSSIPMAVDESVLCGADSVCSDGVGSLHANPLVTPQGRSWFQGQGNEPATRQSTLMTVGDSVDREATANALTADEEQGFRDFFGQLDSAMDGTIPISELVHACRLLRMNLPSYEIEERFNMMDDGDGRVEIGEFLGFMTWAKMSGALTYSADRLEWVVTKVLNERLMESGDRTGVREAVRNVYSGRSWVQHCQWQFDAFLLFSCLYYAAVVLLYVVTFEYRNEGDWWYDEQPALLVVEVCLSLVGMVDLAIGAARPKGEHSQIRITKRKSKARDCKDYMCTLAFAVNLGACFPLDLAGYAIGVHEVHYLGYALRLFAVGKIPRLFHLGQTRLVSAKASQWAFEIAPVLRLCVWIVIFFHICACAFILATPGDVDEYRSAGDRYLVALYWAVYTISTVGYGDVPTNSRGSKALSILMFILSIAANGIFVGKIATLMMVDSSGEHRETMAKTRQILAQFQIPQEMREDILSLQNHMLDMKMSLQSFRDVVGRMPHVVQENLGLYARVQQLRQVPLFHAVSAKCQVALAECLYSKVAARDEVVTVEGDSADALYFITHGFLEVLVGDERVAVMIRGAFFGEVPLVDENAYYASTTRTLTYTELLVLSKQDFDEITRRFPALKKLTRDAIMQQRGEDHDDEEETFEDDSDDDFDINIAIQQRLQKRRLSARGLHPSESGMDPELRAQVSLQSADQQIGPPVRFYGFAGEWGQLCSFWPCVFIAHGLEWHSLEHFFQAMKFEGNPEAVEAIRNSPTPEDARVRGKDRTLPLRPDWDEKREEVMLEGLRAKFTQCPDCREALLRTGNRKLMFSDSADDFWGIGSAGVGRNKLGGLLMTVRQELVEQQAQDEHVVSFHGFTGPLGQLSNQFPSAVRIDGHRYPTVEHYYQAMKWHRTPRETEIASATTPNLAHQIGSERREGETPREDWEEVKRDVMRRALMAKFKRDGACRTTLLRTAPAHIVNADPTDPIWGVGPDKSGANLLGQLLVEVRGALLRGDSDDEVPEDTPSPVSITQSPSTMIPLPMTPELPQSAAAARQQDRPHPSPSRNSEGAEVSGRVYRGMSRAGSGGGAGATLPGELIDLVLQVRETQLQQQEFLHEAVKTLLSNQRVLARRVQLSTSREEVSLNLSFPRDDSAGWNVGPTPAARPQDHTWGDAAQRRHSLSREMEVPDLEVTRAPTSSAKQVKGRGRRTSR